MKFLLQNFTRELFKWKKNIQKPVSQMGWKVVKGSKNVQLQFKPRNWNNFFDLWWRIPPDNANIISQLVASL